MPLRCYG